MYMNKSFMRKEVSSAIKGIALIVMFIYHFFTWPQWYVEGVSYPGLLTFARYFNSPLMLCVPVFAFLSGYFYHYASEKTLCYSLRKMTDLLISHAAVYAILLIPALALGCYSISVSSVIMELFGFEDRIMFFSWYVSFYCVLMLLLPVAFRVSCDRLGGDVFLLLVLPVVAVQCVMNTLQVHVSTDLPVANMILWDIREWFPCVVCGYLFAKYSLFETWMDKLSAQMPGTLGKILFWGMLCVVSFGGRLAMPRFTLGSIQASDVWSEIGFTMDIFYAPMFVYGMAKLLERVRVPALVRCLDEIGRKSMYMWFLHALFFNCCKTITQPMIYAPRNPVLVLLLALIVCYGAAVLVDLAVRPILRLKNKYL